MNFNELILHILLPDGSERTIRLANLAEPTTGFNLLNAPLLVKAEAGAQYKLLNIETGTHQKDQRLLRQNKTLKVLFEDETALELQDYFVASLTPVENAPIYRLENESCNEVQVISHYPAEIFDVSESLVWTDSDSAVDCKVALFNPGSLIGLIPTAAPAAAVAAANIGLGEIAATAIGIPVFAGGKGSAPITPPPPTDTTSPFVVITSNAASVKSNETLVITFTFSEDVGNSFIWDGTSGDIVVTGGTLSALSGTGLVRTATFTPTPNQSGISASISVNAGTYQDGAGNLGLAATSPPIDVDTLSASIAGIQITSATGALPAYKDSNIQWLNEGDELYATVSFNEPVFLNQSSGSPTLALLIGNETVHATNISGTGTQALRFSTKVIGGQADLDGVAIPQNALSLNGATLKDTNDNIAIITSTATADNPNYLVDTTRPTVAITSDTATLNSSQTATITFTFSEDPGSSFVWNGTTGDLVVSGGTLGALSTTANTLTRTAILTPANGVSGGTANVAVNLNSYTDAAGNLGQEAVAGITDKSVNITVNTIPARLSSIAITSADNIQNSLLNAGDVVYVTATYNELVNLNVGAGTPSLKLNIGGTEVNALYASGSGTTDLVFSYTVLAGQTDLNGISIVANSVGSPTFNLNGRTLKDTAGNTAVNTFNAVADNANFLVDTTAPTLVSITSSRSTFLSGQTSTITFTFSEDPGSTFTWNGTSGDVTLVEGTLTAISGTGLTRTATFYPTQGLSGANASLTVNNDLFTDLAGNLGIGNTLTGLVINTMPATLMSMQLTSAVGLQNSTLNAGDTVNVTAHFSDAQTLDLTGGTPTLGLQIGSSQVLATYVSGAGTADLVFGYTVLAGQTDTNGIAINANALQLNGSTLNDLRGITTILPASVVSADNVGYKVDTTAPSMSITSNVASLKAGETANITLTFSEDPGNSFVWDGSSGDVLATGGTLSALSGTGLTRSAVFTPTAGLASGSASITVAANSYQDAAGNNGSAGVTPSISIDTLTPSVVITASTNALKAGETANITFTFSEDPGTSFAWDGSSGDLVIAGGTLGAISGTGLTRTAVFTPTANLASGSASISVANLSYTDTAGNLGSAGATPSISIDTLAPTVSIASNVAALKAGETANITFTFSEDPSTSFAWDGSSGDVVVTGGSLGAISGTGLTRTAIFTPTANLASGTASITVPSLSYTDSAGNSGSAGVTPVISIDTLAPTVSITSNLAALKAGQTANITFTFSEDPSTSFAWDGSLGDLVVSGGTLGAISGTGLTRTAVFTPTASLASGTASITVTNSSYTDSVGNLGSAGVTPAISIDTLAPTVSIASDVAALKAGETANITFTFSEDPGTSFAWNGSAGDLAVSGGTLSAISGTGLTRTAVFTPTNNLASGSAIITVSNLSYTDGAGNTGSAGLSQSISIDTLKPTVSIASNVAALKAGETANITFTFSENPGTSFAWDGSSGDLVVTGGSLGAIIGTGLTRTAVFTPTTNLTSGTGNITVTANSYQDAAGNNGSAGAFSSLSIDTAAPNPTSLALSSATGAVASPLDASVKLLNATDTLSATVTFSEAVTLNTTAGSPTLALVIGSSTVQATYVSGSGTTALVFSTTIASGQNDIDGVAIALNALTLNGATLKDSAGNTSVITSIAVANNPLYLVDTTAPTVSITSDVSALKTGETAAITFTFSEDPGSSFVWASNAGDVIVSGGTLGNISGTGLTRTATFTPTGNVVSGTASIAINAGTYTDAAGNTGGAGSTPLLTYSTAAPTISQVGLSSATGAVSNLLNAGDVIFAKVVFSEAIVLNATGGSPTLNLTIGSTLVQAAYVSGTGSTDFVFSYTILAGQDDANGISIPSAALTLNGSTLKSVPGNSLTLGNASVVDNILYPVDTTAPSVLITSAASSLKVGETSLICFTFTEDPGTSFSLADVTVTGGTLSALTGFGNVRRSTFTPDANLASGSASITVADLSYTDVAGNLGTAGTTPSISIDTLAPTISSVALSGSTGALNNTLNAGDTLNVTATFNDVITVNTDGGSPTLALLVGASTVQATYVSGSGTNALVFTTTIVSGQTDLDGVALPANALTLNGATLKDANGNTSSITSAAVSSNANYLVDTTAPSVVITSDKSSLNSTDTATITFTFSEDPGSSFAWDGTAGDVVLVGGSLGAISGTGLTRTAMFTPAANQSGTASITISDNSYQDAAGNNGAAGTTPTLNLDTLAPTITSLALTSSTGGVVSASDATVNNLNASDTLSATVTFNDVITVNASGGTPTLAFNVGGTAVQATYVSGSGSNALVFTATLASGQNDNNGVALGADALSLNGGTLKDASGNNSSITSLAVADNAKYLVDTTRPTAAVTSNTSALISGQTATITFTFSEDPGTSFVWNGTSGDLVVSGGTLGALSTTGNPLTRTALLTPTSGVSAGTANVAISLNSYTDAAGNVGQEASSGVTDKSADITVNTTTTTVASVALLSATGIQNGLLNQGDVVSVAVNFTEAVFLNANVGTPSIDLTIGSTAVSAQYVSGAGTAQLVFDYTILTGQTDVNGIAINANSLSLNGKVLTDTAGNTPTLNFSTVADNANFLVDTTAPTVVSISSSRSTFLSGETALITFTFSEDPGSTFTWNGSAGDVTLFNGTLSAISGTGLTRTATFLPTQGLTGGSASITVNNDLFTDSAGNLGVGNTLGSLVVNTSPATLMDVQITSAVGVQNSALNAGDVVTVTAHFSEAQTLNTSSGSPTVALQIGGSTVNATYASGAGTADLLFTYTILAGQTDVDGIALGVNSLSLNGSTLKDPRTNTTTLSVPATADNSNFTVDTTAPFLSITSNVGQVKVGETANITFTFSEDPGNTFTWNGTAGDVTLSNGTLSAIAGTGVTRTAVFTPTAGVNSGTASISVSAGAYQDAAGNNGSAGGTPSLTLDTLAPTISSIALSGSTGILNTYLNAGDTANVSVSFTEVVNLDVTGGSPTVALLVGSSTVQATYVSGAGTNTLVFTTTIVSGQNDADGIAIAINALSLNGAVLTDAAGNTSTPTSAAVSSNSAYMVDTLTPNVSVAFNVASLKAGETATLTVTINDKTGTSFSWNGTAGDLTVTGGTLGALSPFVLSGANYVSTATFTPTAGSTVPGVVSTASAVYTDLAGNPGQVGSSASVSIDTGVPTLTSMNITGASGILSNTLNAGDVVQITATFSEAVVVNTSGGTPKMVLNVGGVNNSASYVSGSGTTDLLFNYTILAGDTDTNGLSYAANAMLLNGGTIKDSAGNSAVITSIARSDNAAYKVDTTAPTVTLTSSTSKLLVGQTANITFTFSEDPGSTFTWDGSAGDITLSNGTLSAISGTGLTRTAVFTPTANVNSGNATVVVNAGSYTDAAGNLGSQGNTPSMTLDTLGLNIYQVIAYNGSSQNASVGTKIGGFLFYQEATVVNTTGGLPTIDLIVGSTLVKATFVPGSPTNSQYLYFMTTVVAGQTDTDGISIVANSLKLNGGSITDASGNNTSLTHVGITDGGPIVDTTPPTLVITSNKSTLKIGETATLTFTASEWIYGFSNLPTASNFNLTGGTLSNWVDVSSLLVKTATFTPQALQQMVPAKIELKAGVIQDYAYNPSLFISPSPVIMIDTFTPTVSISMSNSVLSTARTSLLTFTFSEDPGTSFNWDGTTGDLSFTGGTISAISGTGLTRTATFTPTNNITLWNSQLAVLANSYTDSFGNPGAAATTTFSIDTTLPKATSFTPSSTGVVNSFLNTGDVLVLNVSFDRSYMVLDTSAGTPTLALTIGSTVVQATLVNYANMVLTFNYTILAGQTDTDGISWNANGINFNGAVYQDAYGNVATNVYAATANNASYKVDTTVPTLAITSSRSALLAGQTATITFTFSEDPGSTFAWDGTTGDVSVSGGTLGAISGTGLTRTATFTPTANTASGNASITVAANSYQDTAGNNGTAGTTPVISIDLVAPSVAITSNVSAVKVGGTANITFSFSEDPGSSFAWNGTTGDVAVTGGTLGAISGTGLTRTALFTPSANLASGNASITVSALSYQDAAGNLGTAGTTPSLSIDTVAPTVTGRANSGGLIAGQTTRVYFTFSEDPGTSFTWDGSVGDLTVTGAGNLVISSVPGQQVGVERGFDFTPPANTNSGTTTISVKNASYQDAAGNLGSASGTVTVRYDTVAPTVVITSNLSTVGMGQTANITFTFSEDPGSTFAWDGTTGDVVVTQGTLSAISGTGLTRTAVYTPFADTPLVAASITVAAGNYTDTAGNAGLAGTTPTLNVNTFKNAIYLDDIANNIGGYAIEAPNTGSYFGFAVSLAGDFNGDGYGDVVMGAPLSNFTESNGTVRSQSGAAVVYQGGQNTSNVPTGYSGTGQVNGQYMYYNVTKGWLGFSVAGVGDMNKDGFADVLIGMPQDAASSNPGGAFLVYGKANNATGSLAEYQKDIVALGATPAALSITSTFDTAGFSISSAGDVNGDGWSDMIISAHFQVVAGLAGNTGKTYVVYGSAALSALQTISLGNVGGSVPGFVISGWQAGEESGTSVSSAGDFNGDGKADMLVSAYFNDTAGTNAGMTYVVLGKTGNVAVNLENIKNNIGGFAIRGENASDFSGVSVSSGGDINGDGLGDIIIGAIIGGSANANPYSGKTYVVFGRSTANATIDLGQVAAGVGGFAIVSSTDDEQSGHSVSSAGDINGDGLADIILGAPFKAEGSAANTGHSFVVYGKSSTTQVNLTDIGNNIGGFAIVGQGAQDLSGYSVGAAGDVNGDGLADLIVGAHGYDAAHSGVQTGRSYIIFGSKTGAFAAGSAVDNAGSSANDTLTSTGSQTLAGGTGNDRFISNGADVMLGGMGKDSFWLEGTMITALQNKFGVGGNTTQLAKIDGGGGIDTLVLSSGWDLDFSSISNTSVGNIEGASRINSIERIDLASSMGINEITLRAADVMDMASINWANLNSLDTLGAGGWQNFSGGTSFSTSGVKYHQVAIVGNADDRVNISGWTIQSGKVRDANSIVYDVYLATSNAPAMMLVQENIVRFSVP